MHCPVCAKEMKIERTGVSHGHNDATYDRTVYVCVDDDAWVTKEIRRI